MFDELKDPRPPQVTDVHIISVIARAHRIRRRQRIAMFATSAAFATSIGGIALISRDNSPSNIDLVAGGATEAPSVLPSVLATTIPLPRPAATLVPLSIVEPAAADTAAPGGVAEAAPAVTEAGGFQEGDSAVTNETPTTTIAAPSTVAVPDPPTQFVAVDGNGDLVLVSTETGEPRLLVSHVSSEGGSAAGATPAVFTAGGITPDGRFAYYAEGASATVRTVEIATGSTGMLGLGTGPKLSPNGSRWISRMSDGSVAVHSMTDSEQNFGVRPNATVIDYAWFGDDEVAVLEHDGKNFTVTTVGALTGATSTSLTIAGDYVAGGPDAVTVRFAGFTINGLLLVAQPAQAMQPINGQPSDGQPIDGQPSDGQPIAQQFWIKPGRGSVDPWTPLPSRYAAITADPKGDWLLRLGAEGTLVIDAVAGNHEHKLAGPYQSVGW